MTLLLYAIIKLQCINVLQHVTDTAAVLQHKRRNNAEFCSCSVTHQVSAACRMGAALAARKMASSKGPGPIIFKSPQIHYLHHASKGEKDI